MPWGNREEHNAPKLRKTFSIDKLAREAAKLQAQGVTGRVLLCFTTDPYQDLEVEHHLTRQTVQVLHRHGFTVQILTKNPLRAWELDRDIYGANDAIAATLTCISPARSRLWEPGAPTPGERYDGLYAFSKIGVQTWASLEPVLVPLHSLYIIEDTHQYVSHYKIGRINYIDKLPALYQADVSNRDWVKFTSDVLALLTRLGYEEIADPATARRGTFYLKESLRKYRKVA